MRKLPTVSIDNRPRVRKARLLAVVLIPLLLILSPIIYESVLLCVAGWQGLLGVNPHTHTPILDALNEGFQTVRYDFKSWSHGIFHRTPWRASYVVSFAIFWTAVLALFLRKS